MHTLFSVHFVDRVITLDVDPHEVEYEEDSIRVTDASRAHWIFERRFVLYAMQSEVTDEEFEELTKPEVKPKPIPARRSRTQ